MRDTEERLARLEEAHYFQENRLEALNAALTAQQEQLDRMEKQLSETRMLVRLLREKLDEDPENSLPPHFMPERY
ncbi:MAG: SlyX family protein [Desulfovibrionaceae bacterium]|nr:SlyX family protein [Desulfovibrionaceae bacterium]